MLVYRRVLIYYNIIPDAWCQIFSINHKQIGLHRRINARKCFPTIEINYPLTSIATNPFIGLSQEQSPPPWCSNKNTTSGQIIIFHQHRFPWEKGISLPQLHLGCEVAIIWPDNICPAVIQVCWVLVQDHLRWHSVEPRLTGLGGAGALLVPPGSRREQGGEQELKEDGCWNVMS